MSLALVFVLLSTNYFLWHSYYLSVNVFGPGDHDGCPWLHVTHPSFLVTCLGSHVMCSGLVIYTDHCVT